MRVALYARVSSKTQEKAGTIASQVAALRSHASKAGDTICEESVCRDEGVSGATLDRRGLDRLRDGAEAGLFDAVLVLSPDRLSRKYAYLILIVEEFERLGVPIVFLEQPPAEDPQSCLLMQIQGAVAESERAKLAERYRRGKLHRARQGEVWWTSIPLGYRHIPRRDGVPPHVVIDEDHAVLVRQIFDWHANDGMTVRQIAKGLTLWGPRPPRGGSSWGETTVHRILDNEAYIGTLYYNRRQQLAVTAAEAASGGRVARSRLRPESEWISISIPPIVDGETLQRSQERHAPNRQFGPRRLKEERWLLRRLLRCGRCGRKHACVSDAKRPGRERRYYYRCAKAADFSGRPRCHPSHVRSEPLDQLVWHQIRQHLLDPRLLLRAQKQLGGPATDHAFFFEQIQTTERRLRQAQAQRRRLIDAFQGGFLRRDEFEERTGALAERTRGLEGDHQALKQEQQRTLAGRELLGRLQEFTTSVTDRLDTLSFENRQRLARSLLEEVVLDDSDVHIYFKIPLPKPPFDPSGKGPTSRASRGFGLRSQPGRAGGGGDASTGGRDTQGRSSTVHVHYRFHPLHEHDLELVCTPRAVDGAATVVDSGGRRLKIPAWMLSPEAGELRLSDHARLGARALLNVAQLLVDRLALPETDVTSDSLSPNEKSSERRRASGAASTNRHSRGGTDRATSIASVRRAGVQPKGDRGPADGAATAAGASNARRGR